MENMYQSNAGFVLSGGDGGNNGTKETSRNSLA